MSPAVNEAPALSLPFVRVHELRASATHESWQLLLSQAGEGPGQRLLVLLDGNLSALPAALMQHARVERGVGEPPPCTVVGVGYPGAQLHDRARRERDFLPALPPGCDHGAWPQGRADAFSAFLDDRLLPWLEAQQGAGYAEVGLFGHSFGGLFALHKLLTAPGRFNAFFSLSPSLWWADGWLFNQLGHAANACANRSLYLGIGADERALPQDDAARQALHRERDLQGRFARLVAALQDQGVALQAEILAGEDHGSVVYPGISRAVRWLTRPLPRDVSHHHNDSHPT